MHPLWLRGRLTLLAVGAVGIVLVLGSGAAYVAVRSALRDQIDQQLGGQASFVRGGRAITLAQISRLPQPTPRAGGAIDIGQALLSSGRTVRVLGAGSAIPVTSRDRRVARGQAPAAFSDRVVDGAAVRVYVFPVAGGALLIARTLTGVQGALHDLRVVLALLVVVGTLASAGLARLFARPALVPVTHLTEAAEHIQATGDLGRRVTARSEDEVGRLAVAFNGMLDRVEESVDAQRQLVADASHELRTPVSALRTNIEVLSSGGDRLSEDQRRLIFDDLGVQADELGDLVADLIELARERDGTGEPITVEEVRLDLLVVSSVARARRHAPGVSFVVELEPCVVDGAPDRLARAVNNLLDNAAKYSGAAGPVDVAVRADGTVSVRDRGPGVDPGDERHIFDRFARGSQAREHAGSGLGLAIVRQVAEAHGGTVLVESPDGGGARFVLSLPISPA